MSNRSRHLETLQDKFANYREPAVSEEMLGAYLENSLSGSDLREVGNAIDMDGALAELMGIIRDDFQTDPAMFRGADAVTLDISSDEYDAWELPEPDEVFGIYDDVIAQESMADALSVTEICDATMPDEGFNSLDNLDSDELLPPDDTILPSDI